MKTVREKKKETSKEGGVKKVWSAAEDSKLALMSQRGVSLKEISIAIGKSVNADSSRRRRLGIGKEENVVALEKGSAKALSRIAREIARMNGKRITMSMFFVEDLD